MSYTVTVKQATTLFFLVFILMLFIGGALDVLESILNLKGYTEIRILLSEWLLIFLPTLLLTRHLKLDVKESLRLNKVDFKTILISLGIGLSAWVWALIIGGIIAIILRSLGLPEPPLPLPVPQNTLEWFLSFLGVSLSAGFCEEVMFRGFILKGFQSWGFKKAIFFSSFLFAAMHGSFIRFFPILFLGLLFGYIALKTNSIVPTVIAHATNNGLSLLAMWFYSSADKLNVMLMVLTGAVFFLLIIFALVALPLLLWTLNRKADVISISVNDNLGGETHEKTEGWEVPLSKNWASLLRLWTFDIAMLISIVLASAELLQIMGIFKTR